MVKKKRKRKKQKRPAPGRIPIGLLPVYIRETNRVFVGCHREGQRYEIDTCIYRKCPERSECPQYQMGREMKEDLGIPITPEARRIRVVEELEEEKIIPYRGRKRKVSRSRSRSRTRSRKQKSTGFEWNETIQEMQKDRKRPRTRSRK